MWSMHYHEVWVSSPKYHSDKPLTYSCDKCLPPGTLVVVPMQRNMVVAIVIKEVTKPQFATKAILRRIDNRPLPPQLIMLASWLRDYYPAPFGQIISLLLPASLTTKTRDDVYMSKDKSPEVPLPPLTNEQSRVIKDVLGSSPQSVILHGDTGTGKTRVYLELVKKTLNKGKSAIILTPEIGLTPQMASACSSAFPDRTVTVHSDLTPATRRNIWLHILSASEPLVVVGARSALFSPLKDIGLVVVDEFHDTAYKQEQAPHYQASRVAARLASLHKAQLILGSATPTVSDYYAFEQKHLPILRMRERALNPQTREADVSVIDLKNRNHFRRSAWLSDAMIHDIGSAFRRKEQALVFLNRRGTARLVLCQSCGWQALCPRCDLALTYHGDTHMMQCHTCGFSQKTPSSCQQCSAENIIFRAIGTKSLVTELERLFPDAVIKRFDSDTAKSEKLEKQYADIRNGSVDILVGTQMLGKGLDLPKLSVLGVVLADTSLSFPDYTAEERTFQLLTQVIGRVHRGHIPGTIHVQTYHPESLLLKAAIEKDYTKFYKQQINERKQFGFPPFRHVAKLTCSRASATGAKHSANKLAEYLRENGKRIEVIGPSPSFVEKTHNRYRWQIVVKAVNRNLLVDIIKELPANWSYDIDPNNLL